MRNCYETWNVAFLKKVCKFWKRKIVGSIVFYALNQNIISTNACNIKMCVYVRALTKKAAPSIPFVQRRKITQNLSQLLGGFCIHCSCIFCLVFRGILKAKKFTFTQRNIAKLTFGWCSTVLSAHF